MEDYVQLNLEKKRSKMFELIFFGIPGVILYAWMAGEFENS